MPRRSCVQLHRFVCAYMRVCNLAYRCRLQTLPANKMLYTALHGTRTYTPVICNPLKISRQKEKTKKPRAGISRAGCRRAA